MTANQHLPAQISYRQGHCQRQGRGVQRRTRYCSLGLLTLKEDEGLDGGEGRARMGLVTSKCRKIITFLIW